MNQNPTENELIINSKSTKQKLTDCTQYDELDGSAKKHRPNDYVQNSCSSSSITTTLDEDSSSSKVATSSNESDETVTAATSSSATTASTTNWINMLKNHNLPIQTSDFENPRQLLGHLLPTMDVTQLPANLDDFEVCRLIYQLMSSSQTDNTDPTTSFASAISSLFMVQRDKLLDFNTIEQCVDMIHKSKNIIVLTGAGCSVSCGIPDFRSRDGVYSRLRVDFPDLPDPQSMFDIFYFEHDPRPFFKFAKEIYPGQFKPSLSHLFIKKLEENNKLLRNYTQNIDTLEVAADIKNSILCHGSFATASCTVCKLKVDSDFIRERIFNQDIPYCDQCKLNETETAATQTVAIESVEETPKRVGILKPDIIFFGEGLPEIYHQSINEDKSKCDLLIVIGSSLKVKPVANIPHLLPADVPQILINRESLKHMNFDVELLGDCDVIVNELLLRLEEKRKQEQWSNICQNKELLTQISDLEAQQLLFQSEAEVEETEEANSTPKIDPCKKYTKDYLKESSFLFLKPNMYVFHGAELSLRNAKKRLKRLRKKLNISDDLVSSESEENFADSDKKSSKESYLTELYKNPVDGLDDDDSDDEEYDEDSDSDSDSSSSDSDLSDGDDAEDEVEENEPNLQIDNNNLTDLLNENVDKSESD